MHDDLADCAPIVYSYSCSRSNLSMVCITTTYTAAATWPTTAPTAKRPVSQRSGRWPGSAARAMVLQEPEQYNNVSLWVSRGYGRRLCGVLASPMLSYNMTAEHVLERYSLLCLAHVAVVTSVGADVAWLQSCHGIGSTPDCCHSCLIDLQLCDLLLCVESMCIVHRS